MRSVGDGDTKRVVSTAGGDNPRWRADGRELFYVQEQTLMSVSLQRPGSVEFGLPAKLFDGAPVGIPSPVPNGSSYDVSADGQQFILIVRDETARQSPITVIVNWPALLKR